MVEPRRSESGDTLTVMLVHGAFSNMACWNGLISLLQERDCAVVAVMNPLRGLDKDVAYVASAAAQIDGSVLLVGAGYGGMVVTNAALVAGNVTGLVYVAAFAPDAGESVMDISERFPETLLGPALRPSSFPNGGSTYAVEMTLDRQLFPAAFAADLPPREARAMAAAQRPIAIAGMEDKSGEPAWKRLPSWYLVASADQIVHPEAQRFMARRAGAQLSEIDASHSVVISRSDAVSALILEACRQVR
jgi:pimeloyl-ACP methyl ester carboxylesterase